MKSIAYLTRRDFIRGSLAMGSILILPKNILAQGKSPNEKVNLACVGVGGQGGSDLNSFGKIANIIGLADVDENRSAAARQKHPAAKFHADFRKLFDMRWTTNSTESWWRRRTTRITLWRCTRSNGASRCMSRNR